MGNHLYQLVLFISSCGNTIFNSFTSILSERVISEKKISHVKKRDCHLLNRNDEHHFIRIQLFSSFFTNTDYTINSTI